MGPTGHKQSNYAFNIFVISLRKIHISGNLNVLLSLLAVHSVAKLKSESSLLSFSNPDLTLWTKVAKTKLVKISNLSFNCPLVMSRGSKYNPNHAFCLEVIKKFVIL